MLPSFAVTGAKLKRKWQIGTGLYPYQVSNALKHFNINKIIFKLNKAFRLFTLH